MKETMGNKVLVIDDEELIVNATAKFLQANDFYVVTARSGHEALSALSTEHGFFNYVIMDVAIRDMTGPEIYKAIKTKNEKTKILFLSGWAGTEPGLPPDEVVIEKPVPLEFILSAIRSNFVVN